MGTIKCSKLCIKDSKRVSHTLLSQATFGSHRCFEEPSKCATIKRNVCNNRPNDRPKSPSKSSARTELSILNFSCSQERRDISPDIQFKGTKCIYNDRKIPAAQHVPNSRLFATERLALQSRSITGLLPSSCRPQPQEVPSANVSRPVIGDDLFTLWPEYGTQNFRQFNQLDCPSTQAAGCPDSGVLGRFFARSSRQDHTSTSRSIGNTNFRDIRMDYKLQQVDPSAVKITNILGHQLGPMDQSETTTRGKAPFIDVQTDIDARKRQHKSRGLAKSSGPPEFCQLHCTTGSPELSRSIESSQYFSEKKSQVSTQDPSGRQRESEVVVAELQAPIAHSCVSTLTLPYHGCIGFGMGSSIRQPSAIGVLDTFRTKPSLQSKRNARNLKSFTRSLSTPESQHSFSAVRQQNRNSISPSRRRYQIDSSVKSDLPDISDSQRISNTPKNTSHPRDVQWTCRSSVEVETNSRMASPSQQYSENIQEMGNSPNRSICVQSRTCSNQLCLPRHERSSSIVSRRILTALELSSGVGIPPTFSHSQGIKSFEPVPGDLPTSGSPMGTSFLESRCESTSFSPSVYTSESRRSPNRRNDRPPTSECAPYDTGSVEMWGWVNNLKDWSNEQISLLQKSWRPSTRKIYDCAWKKWLVWARDQGIDPYSPNGNDLAKYLAELHLQHKLSYNTILVHKSAISTLCNVECSGTLSSHPVVKQVLKSISLQKPCHQKPPIWNIDVLASYIENYNIDVTNIFQTQRHTAVLLLLCSGRRVHDLTLLSVDPNHCNLFEDSVVFWPIFGSKTDSVDYRQSGWRLSTNPGSRNLDPVFWIKHTIDLLNDIRKSSKCNTLFVNTKGKPKPASRTIIGGWVKTIMKDSGITATPGSIRSAVASKNWLDNYPLQDVLSRGNWRSSNTFCKFYRREVMPASVTPSVTALFSVAD